MKKRVSLNKLSQNTRLLNQNTHLKNTHLQCGIFVLLIILTPVIISFFSFALTLGDSRVADINIDRYSSYNKNSAKEVTHMLLNYFSSSEKELPRIEVFSVLERQHLWDVKNVIRNVLFALWILLIIWVILFIFSVNRYRALFFGGWLTIAMTILAVIIPFSWLFGVFHKIFFPQGNYMFDASNPLIQMYPASFFYAYAFRIGIITVGFALAFVLIGWLLSKKNRDPGGGGGGGGSGGGGGGGTRKKPGKEKLF